MTGSTVRLLALVGVLAICTGLHAQSPAEGRFSTLFNADALWKDFERLASPDLQGRKTGTEGTRAARRLITDRFIEAGLSAFTTDFQQRFRFTRQGEEQEGVNVAGRCPGTRPDDPRAIVVSAHYDHVGVRNGQTYPGADDNASGTSALLALASLCRKSPWQHDIVFVAFDAEEQGLQGARAFVATPPIPKARLALNVNMDMLSRSATREIFIAGTAYHPELRKALDPVASRSQVTVRFGHDDPKAGMHEDWTLQSDHAAFHAAGIPFVYFGVEDHPDYHKPTDTLEKINAAFFFQVVATVLDAINTLDRALPEILP